jgi:hypothetical protein
LCHLTPDAIRKREDFVSLWTGIRTKLGIFRELWLFMRMRKKFWLGAIMVFLVLLGVLIVFTEGSALAPFIYALF